jgi:hypothetical protein
MPRHQITFTEKLLQALKIEAENAGLNLNSYIISIIAARKNKINTQPPAIDKKKKPSLY